MSDDEPDAPPSEPKRAFAPPIRHAAPVETKRGLTAVQKSRVERKKVPRPGWKALAWFGLILGVALGLYGYRASSDLDRERQALLAKQRATRAELEPLWKPMREKIEGMVVALGKEPEADFVDREALATFKFQDLPGIYLRLRADQAGGSTPLHEIAHAGLKDGFTACLLRTPGQSPVSGRTCRRSSECATGEICNEYEHCARPAQPYNLRLAYRSLFVTEEAWAEEVRAARTDLRIEALLGTFDDAMRTEIPIAIELLSKAQFFLLVLDERPPPPAAPTGPDAGPPPEDVEVVGGKTWPQRVGLWRLSDGKQLLRLRREVDGALMGGAPSADVEVEAARLRQARSCALALEVRTAIGDTGPAPSASAVAPPAASGSSAPEAPPAASGAASAGPAPSAAP